MARPLFLLLVATGLVAAGEPVLVQGRVTSAGEPVPGAIVTVHDWHDVIGERGVDAEPGEPAFILESGADGTFVVPASKLEGPVITVAAKGFASVTWREDEGAGVGVKREVALPAAGTFAGRAVGPDGPVPGVHVYAVEWDALELEDHPDPLAAAADLLWGSGQYAERIAYRYVATVADGEGKFLIPDADAAKRYAVIAVSRKLGPSMHPNALVPGEPLEDLRLDAAVTVRVHVVDEKGEPLIPLSADLPGSPRPIKWGGGDKGVFQLGPVGAGFHVLELTLSDRGQVRHAFTVPRDAHDFETTAIIGEGGTISGVVLDIEGRPVVGARVYLSVWDSEAREGSYSELSSDEFGKFLARGLPAGSVSSLYVSARGFQKAVFRDLVEPIKDLAVKLRPARAVTLEVSPPKGIPRRDHLQVATRSLEDGGGPWVKDRVSWNRRVTIDGVPLGRAAIRIWMPGSALLEREIVLEPGEKPVPLEPAPLDPARTVTVRLVDEDGFPLPGLRVHAEVNELPPVDWTEIQRTTGADGLAVLELHDVGVVKLYIEEGCGRQRARRRFALPSEPRTVDVLAGPPEE